MNNLSKNFQINALQVAFKQTRTKHFNVQGKHTTLFVVLNAKTANNKYTQLNKFTMLHSLQQQFDDVAFSIGNCPVHVCQSLCDTIIHSKISQCRFRFKVFQTFPLLDIFSTLESFRF